MIASSSVTLRARSSRSACKSWNICKLMSYQRAVTGGGLCVIGVETPAWVPGLYSRLFPLPVPAVRFRWECGALTHTRTHTPSTTTFDPCLKLTLPQASYSPWIPIIVSRIKTLSAKIFSASLIWCIPSPCEDRYSRQGKEHKPKKLLAKMQVILLLCFSQYSSAVRRLKQSTCLPSTLKHIPVFFIFFLSLYLPHSLAMLLHEVRLLPCRAGRHQHAHYRPASRRRHNTAGFTLSQGFSCHLHSLSSPGECFVSAPQLSFLTLQVTKKLSTVTWQNEAGVDLLWNLIYPSF